MQASKLFAGQIRFSSLESTLPATPRPNHCSQVGGPPPAPSPPMPMRPAPPTRARGYIPEWEHKPLIPRSLGFGFFWLCRKPLPDCSIILPGPQLAGGCQSEQGNDVSIIHGSRRIPKQNRNLQRPLLQRRASSSPPMRIFPHRGDIK